MRSQFRYSWIFGFAVFVITFLIFSPALDYSFLNWDDDALVRENPYIRNLSLEGIVVLFSSYCGSNYTPFERVSYALDYKVWGMNPWGFHFTNILLHSLNACGVFILSLKVFSLSFPSEGQSYARKCAFAALGAFIFALHPLRLESVVWISERRDVLSLFFLLPCVVCYLEYAKTAAHTRKGEFLYWIAFLLFVSSLLSKASGVTLPMVLLLLDFFPLKRFDFSWPRFPSMLRCILEKIPFLVVSLIIGLVAISGQHMGGAMPSDVVYPWSARIANSFLAIVFYVQKWLIPYPLSPLYETASHHASILDLKVLGCFLWICLMTIYSFRMIRKRPGLIVAWFTFLVIILPFTGLLQAGRQSATDRYTYVSMISFAMILSAWLYAVFTSDRKTLQKVLGGGVALWIGSLVLIHINQIPVWENSISLWEKVLEEIPHEQIPLNNLSCALVAEKKYHLAVVMSRAATQKAPRWDDAWYNYGVALSRCGYRDRSIVAFREAVRINPGFGGAHFALANLLFLKGDYRDARPHYFQAVQEERKPEYLVNLGIALNQTGTPSLAIKYLSWAAFQNDATAFIAWARILASRSELEQARGLLSVAYRRIPDERILELQRDLIEKDPRLSAQAKRGLLNALPRANPSKQSP
jgi:protein O-mannosyl-transferase